MAATPDESLAEIRDVLVELYAINDAMNQLLLANLDPKAWRARLPGTTATEGRTIASIFTHLHNSRLRWLRRSAPHLRRSAPHLKCPGPLDPHRCTIKQATAAHKKSIAQCVRMLRDALSTTPERKVTKFSRDGWMGVWPAGGAMFGYMFAHEAHHRGQIVMLAHQLGYRLPVPTAYGIWHWDKLWKAQGLKTRPR